MIILPVKRFNTKHLGSSGTGRTICLCRFIASLNKTSRYHDCGVQTPLQPSSFLCLHFHFFSSFSFFSSSPPTVTTLPVDTQYSSVLVYQRGFSAAACVFHNNRLSGRYHRLGYLIIRWGWSGAAICSRLLFLRFNYTTLIGFCWCTVVPVEVCFFFPGKQNTDREKKSLTLTFSEG